MRVRCYALFERSARVARVTISAYGDTKLFQALRTAIFFTSTTTMANISTKQHATRLEHGAGVARDVAGNVSSKKFKILPDMRDFYNSLEMDVFTLSGKRNSATRH